MGRGGSKRQEAGCPLLTTHPPMYLLCLGVGLTNGLGFQGRTCIFWKWGWGRGGFIDLIPSGRTLVCQDRNSDFC